MKLLTTALLATLGALIVYAARRRIIFALKTGAILYVALLFIRLLFSLLSPGSLIDHLEEWFVPLLILVLVWFALTWASTAYATRRDREKQRLRRASGAGRAAR